MSKRKTAKRKQGPGLRVPGRPGVVLAGPNPGTVDATFFGSVTACLLHDANNHKHITERGGCIWLESSPRIFSARCQIVEGFLDLANTWDYPPEWLLWVDSDMTFEADVVDRMVDTVTQNPEIKILGGLCFAGGRGGRKRAFPTLYTVDDAENFDPEQPLKLSRSYNYYTDSLVKVNATGGAFIMVHREVYETMAEKYAMRGGYPNPYIWYREYEQAGKAYGEDIFFCLAAGSCGYPTWVHTGIKIGHMKRFNLDEEEYSNNLDLYVKGDLAEVDH